ncbi:MAG: hypothetical protein ACRCYV_08545 [Aeromonas sp.]
MTSVANERSEVHKFGGSSLADARCFLRVARLIEQQSAADALIVVSAAGKTTNQLLEIIGHNSDNPKRASQLLRELGRFQAELINALLLSQLRRQLRQQLSRDLHFIAHRLVEPLDEFSHNQLLSFGEVWSARLLATVLRERNVAASMLDARQFLRAIDGAELLIDEPLSRHLLQLALKSQPDRVVITGFIAANHQGRTLLLGRNGSDYSATLIAALISAPKTTIWSDVAGVYSADPRRVAQAELLPELTLQEAHEVARLGSSVLHRRTLQPVARSCQQLTLRSSLAPEQGASHIVRPPLRGLTQPILMVSDHVHLLELTLPAERAAAVQKQLEADLRAAQLAPLAKYYQAHSQQLLLAYHPELSPHAFNLLNQWQFQLGTRQLLQHQGYSLVALVGPDVTRDNARLTLFNQHVHELAWQFNHASSNGLSFIAILRCMVPSPWLSHLHQQLQALAQPAQRQRA